MPCDHAALVALRHETSKALLFFCIAHILNKNYKSNSDTSAIGLSAELLIMINKFCAINENQQCLTWHACSTNYIFFKSYFLMAQNSSITQLESKVQFCFADWCKGYFGDLILPWDNGNQRGASLSVSNWWNPPKLLVVQVIINPILFESLSQ